MSIKTFCDSCEAEIKVRSENFGNDRTKAIVKLENGVEMKIEMRCHATHVNEHEGHTCSECLVKALSVFAGDPHAAKKQKVVEFGGWSLNDKSKK